VTLEVTVGIAIEGESDADGSLGADASTIPDALGAWQDIGADHLQLAVNPSTAESFATVLDGIRMFRG
jgi:hypothetical protein